MFLVCTLAPAFAILGAYVVWPTLYSLYLSFFKTRLNRVVGFVGVDNYLQLFHDAAFYNALRVTVLYTLGTVLGAIILGIAVAIPLSAVKRGRGFYGAALFLPYAIPYAAFVVLWVWLFDPRLGLVNYLLSFGGLGPFPWLKSEDMAVLGWIIMGLWKRVGFAALVFLVGIQAIPKSQYEAAALDGAGWWSTVWAVTVPHLRPLIVFIGVINAAMSLQLFAEPWVMTDTGGSARTSLVYLLYQKGFQGHNMGLASAVAMILCAAVLVVQMALARRYLSDD